MSEKTFRRLCIDHVYKYTMDHLDKSDEINFTKEDIYVVWECKILKNNKALLSTELRDGMYYEITYNGEKDELYLDAYKKFENQCHKHIMIKEAE